MLILCCLNSMNAVGLSLLVGHAGQISLGHAGFYGLAAYVSAYLSTTLGWSVGLSMLTAVAVTVVVSLLVGIPSLETAWPLSGHGHSWLWHYSFLSILFTESVEITGGPSGFEPDSASEPVWA